MKQPLDLKKWLNWLSHPTAKHFDGTLFTVGQMYGVYPIPIPIGVQKIFEGGSNITIGREEHHFLFYCDTKIYLENILTNHSAKERLLNATFEVADMKNYLKEMVVGPFTYIGKMKEKNDATDH